jgi:hypothetical protein
MISVAILAAPIGADNYVGKLGSFTTLLVDGVGDTDNVNAVAICNDTTFLAGTAGGTAVASGLARTTVAGDLTTFSSGIGNNEYIPNVMTDESSFVLTVPVCRQNPQSLTWEVQLVHSNSFGDIQNTTVIVPSQTTLWQDKRPKAAMARYSRNTLITSGTSDTVSSVIPSYFLSSDSYSYGSEVFTNAAYGEMEGADIVSTQNFAWTTAGNQTDPSKLGGAIAVTTDGGTTVTYHEVMPLLRKQFDISMNINGSHIWTCGHDGTVFKSTDSGANFSLVDVGAGTTTLRAIWISQNGQVIIITSQDGNMYRSINRGVTWEKRLINIDTNRTLTITVNKAEDRMLIGTENGNVLYSLVV